MINTSDFQQKIRSYQYMLPPLSGYTDFPFRKLLASFSPCCIITEMVNARAVLEKNQKTEKILQMESGNHLKGSQLVGNSPDEMADAAKVLELKGFDFIDINMGCTVKKVIKKGQGVALMKNEQLAQSIVHQVVDAVKIPVSVKLRTGFSDATKNIVSLAKKLEKAGASALIIHGRPGDRKFGSFIDYNCIARAKRMISIPVIANGGITGENAKKILQKTHADAVMPGRSLIGNPWIVLELHQYLHNQYYQPPILKERKTVSLKHVKYQCQFYGEKQGIIRSRKSIPKYFSAMMNNTQFKSDILKISTYDQMKNLIENIYESHGMITYR
jgi:tRNA-dihydrouridine synthase B